MSEDKAIKVSIAGRQYPLTVPASDEERILNIAKRINDSMQNFQENYAVRDKQDLLAMAALQLVAEDSVQKTPPADDGKELIALRDWLKSELV